MATSRIALPLPDRGPARGRRYARLVWLEFRFSYAWLFMPLAVAAAIWFFNAWGWQSGRRWDVVSSTIAQSFLLIGPAGAMWAAFVAAREGSSRLADLTASLPVRPLPRHLLVTGTPVLGSVLVYVLGALAILWRYGRDITWGEPNLALIGFGAVVVLACALVGAATGRVVRGRFAPVIVSGSIFLYFVMSLSISNPGSTLRGWALLAYPRDRLKLISPLVTYPQELTADEAPLAAGYLICGVVIAAALAMLIGSHGQWKAALPFAAVAAVVFAIAVPMTTVPVADRETAQAVAMAGPTPIVNPPLVCAGEAVTTCLHQIDARDLDQASAAADAMLGPLQGLPGVPSRIEMRADLPSEPEVMRLGIAGTPIDASGFASSVLHSIFGVGGNGTLSPAEQAIAVWVMRPVAAIDDAWFVMPPSIMDGGYASGSEMHAWQTEIEAVADRFAALTPAEQRAWLETNWEALRAGELTLEDLP